MPVKSNVNVLNVIPEILLYGIRNGLLPKSLETSLHTVCEFEMFVDVLAIQADDNILKIKF